jgi:predicted 3-demethylubiquinone-9 3-methyltransferase (glyoxalase superfamily)
MQTNTVIPFLNFIKTQGKFPPHNFTIENKKSRRLPVFYSLISHDYSKRLLSVNNYIITDETITKLQKALENDDVNRINAFKFGKSFATSLSIKNQDHIDTYLITLFVLNGNKSINIIRYQNTDLKNWLGGVFENESDLHLSVMYNLNNEERIRFFNLFALFIELKNLKEFDRIICKPNLTGNNNSLNGETEGLNVFNIDLSYLREYFIPTSNRREHYRWQFCGPGRTILRQVKVKETIVKEYTRKGKRII